MGRRGIGAGRSGAEQPIWKAIAGATKIRLRIEIAAKATNPQRRWRGFALAGDPGRQTARIITTSAEKASIVNPAGRGWMIAKSPGKYSAAAQMSIHAPLRRSDVSTSASGAAISTA